MNEKELREGVEKIVKDMKVTCITYNLDVQAVTDEVVEILTKEGRSLEKKEWDAIIKKHRRD